MSIRGEFEAKRDNLTQERRVSAFLTLLEKKITLKELIRTDAPAYRSQSLRDISVVFIRIVVFV